MPIFKSNLAATHRLHNLLQTVLIVVCMALLLGICGELLLGEGAFFWVVLATVISLFIRPQIPIKLLMSLYQAQALTYQEAPELIQLIESLASRAKLATVPVLYYVSSSATNAFTLGSLGDSAIAVTDGLLRRLSTRELANVLAHEISHLNNHDIKVMGLADLVSRLTRLMSSIGLMMVVFSLPLLFLVEGIKVSWLGIGLLIIAPALIDLLQAALSRTREFNADIGAVELTDDPEGMASALVKVSPQNRNGFQRVFIPQRNDSGPSLLRSHPPTEERIRRLLLLNTQQKNNSLVFSEGNRHDLGRREVNDHPKRHWGGLWY